VGRGARSEMRGRAGIRTRVVGSKTVVDGGAGDSVARESEGFGKRNRSGSARLDELPPYMCSVSLSFALPTPPLFIARTRPVHNINTEFANFSAAGQTKKEHRRTGRLVLLRINWLVRHHARYRVRVLKQDNEFQNFCH